MLPPRARRGRAAGEAMTGIASVASPMPAVSAELARAEVVAAEDVVQARRRAVALKLSFAPDARTEPAFQPSFHESSDA